MRLSAMAEEEGCAKLIPSPAPRLKLLQSITARWLDWFTVTWFAPETMLAVPPLTTPPCGNAYASAGWSARHSADAIWNGKKRSEEAAIRIASVKEPSSIINSNLECFNFD